MLNNYTAAARLLESLGCSYFLTLTNANSTENISVNYTFCVKIRKKSINNIHCKMFIVNFTVPCWQHRRQCGTVNITVTIVICLQYEIVNVTLPYCIVNNTVL